MKKTILSIIMLLFISLFAFMEESAELESREVPPAPVVSGLSATCSGNQVKLEWLPAVNIKGENIILRSTKPITSANYSAAERIGTVSINVSTFNDTIQDGSEYYYAILTRDSDGIFYDFFLPSSNSLLVSVSSENSRKPVVSAIFSKFDAMVRNDAIIMTWNSSLQGKNMVLYRSTSPFTTMSSLVSAIVISSFQDNGAPFVDYPVPGVPYYYIILDEDSIKSGQAEFIPDKNTNRIPVEIPSMYAKIQRTPLPTLRPMPLPWLNPDQQAEIPALQFSADTEKIITSLITYTSKKNIRKLSPYVFKSDLDSTSGGEEYTLKNILESNFREGSWEKAITSLNNFLSIRRSEDTIARTRFYLGEAYYFSGDYRNALLSLLMSQDNYYEQSEEWIQYVLEKSIM